MSQHYIVQFIGDHWAAGITGKYMKIGGGSTSVITQARVLTVTKDSSWEEPRPVWGPDGTTGEMWVAHKLIPTDRELTN